MALYTVDPTTHLPTQLGQFAASAMTGQIPPAVIAGVKIAPGTITLPNNAPLSWLSSDGTTLNSAYVSPDNLFQLGTGSPSIVLHASAYPTADNVQGLGASNLAFSGVYAHGFQVPSGPNVIPTLPVGNEVPGSVTSLDIRSTDTADAVPQFGAMIGMTATHGTGIKDPQNARVALYTGMICQGCKAGWSYNPLGSLRGPVPSDFYSLDVIENDLNMQSMGDNASRAIVGGTVVNADGSVSVIPNGGYSTYGKVDTTKTIYVGSNLITGIAYDEGVRANYAIAIGGENRGTVPYTQLFERGIWFAPPPEGARLVDLQTDDTSQAIIADFGNHQMGLDLSHGGYSVAPILLPHGTALSWTTASAGTVDPLFVDNQTPALLHVGHGLASIVMEATAYPASDSGEGLGAGNLRFSSIYSHIVDASDGYDVGTNGAKVYDSGGGTLALKAGPDTGPGFVTISPTTVNLLSGQALQVSGTTVIDGSRNGSFQKINITPTTPASSSAPCTKGDMVADNQSIYVCVATNSWLKAPLQPF